MLTCPCSSCSAAAFENLAGFDAARQLGEALPATVEPVVQAVQAAAKDLPALATANPGAKGADQLTQLQKVRMKGNLQLRCSQLLPSAHCSAENEHPLGQCPPSQPTSSAALPVPRPLSS